MIPAMRWIGQACLGYLLSFGLFGQEAPAFDFDAPVVRESVFKDNLGLLGRERDEYAEALAVNVANTVAEQKASAASLFFARRALGLALHLSSRNRRAVVLNHQLGKGIIPQKIDPKYHPKTLAALFMTRAETLFEQKGEANLILARALIDMAATIDPMNEDAVYAFEVQKIDYGELSWERFMKLPKDKAASR